MDKQNPDARFVSEITAAQPKMRAYVAKLMMNAPATDDVLQESNRVLWEKRSDWNPDTVFLKWAYRVCYFQVKAWRRDHGRDKLVFSDDLLEQLATEHPREAQPSRCQDGLIHCLKRLPRDQHAKIMKRYDQETSLNDLAAENNVSPNTLAQQLRRIRQQLQRCIESYLSNVECDPR